MGKFTNQCALVTGAAGGIGQAIVETLRSQGARVAAADRDTDGVECDAQLPGDLTDVSYCDSLASLAYKACLLYTSDAADE